MHFFLSPSSSANSHVCFPSSTGNLWHANQIETNIKVVCMMKCRNIALSGLSLRDTTLSAKHIAAGLATYLYSGPFI